MLRAAHLAVLATTLGVLACMDSLTDPEPFSERRREIAPSDAPRVPVTAAIAFVSTRDGIEHVYVANADGSDVTRVTEGSSPAWSRDGRRIAFVRQGSFGGPDGIYVLDLERSELRYAGEGHSPAWSPDGRIVVTRPAGWLTSGLYVMNDDGSDATQLFSSSGALERCPGWPCLIVAAVAGPAGWSPDGRHIAFRDHYTLVRILSAAGSRAHELEQLRGVGSTPAWSPDGSRIAVISAPGPWQICDRFPALCRPGSGAETSSVIHGYDVASANLDVIDAIYPLPAVHAGNPDWSPDGNHLVFDLVDPTPSPHEGFDRRRIFTVSVETGEVRRLIADAANPAAADYEDYAPVWSRAVR